MWGPPSPAYRGSVTAPRVTVGAPDDLGGGEAGGDLVGARLHLPPLARDVEAGEVPGRELELDVARLTRRQLRLDERLELPPRTLAPGVAADIDLQHRRAGPVAGVGQPPAQRHPPAAGEAARVRREVGELEAGVAEPVPEREERRDAGAVVVAVADEEPLGVAHPAVAAGIDLRVAAGGRVVGPAHREGLRQTAAGLGVAEEHVGDGVARLLPRIPGLKHRRDVADPRHLDRPAGLQHHHGARVGARHRGDQLVLPPGQGDARQVAAFGVPLAVAPDEEQRDLGAARRLHGGGDLGVAHRLADADPEGGEGEVARRLGGELDHHLAGAPGLQLDLADDLVAALLEEGRARLPVGPGVGHQPAVEVDPREPRRADADAVGPLASGTKRPVSRAE